MSKKYILQLKHYIQGIYLKLLSTTCVKNNQIRHFISETISHFSRHNCDMVKHELRVESLKARVESLNARVEIQKCEFQSTSYELESTNYEVESTSSRIVKNPMKTHVNRVLKSSSFPMIVSPKLFGNS